MASSAITASASSVSRRQVKRDRRDPLGRRDGHGNVRHITQQQDAAVSILPGGRVDPTATGRLSGASSAGEARAARQRPGRYATAPRIIPAATVSLVDSSIRMKLPVVRLRA